LIVQVRGIILKKSLRRKAKIIEMLEDDDKKWGYPRGIRGGKRSVNSNRGEESSIVATNNEEKARKYEERLSEIQVLNQ